MHRDDRDVEVAARSSQTPRMASRTLAVFALAALAACAPSRPERDVGVEELSVADTQQPSDVVISEADAPLDAPTEASLLDVVHDGTNADAPAEISSDVALADGPSDAPAGPLPDFSLTDVNPASPTAGRMVSPRQHLGAVSAWYFASAT